MSTLSAPHETTRATAHAAGRLAAWHTPLLYLLVGMVALVPRLLDLGRFLDSDERNFWLGRSEEWLNALQSGDFAATAISTHPGVTTMWLGTAGIVLRRTLLEWGLIESLPFPLMLALTRTPVVLVHTAALLVGYWLLRRLLSVPLATLAALLWATDPFVVHYSRILHVDGLTGTFLTLAVLAACVAWLRPASDPPARPPRDMLLLSGACGALAVLSKSPGLIVLPMVGGIALYAAWLHGRGGWWARLRAAVPALLWWGGAFGVAALLVYPALWAAPLRVFGLIFLGVDGEGGTPHVVGNYFLGQADPTPDARYYPVALALRTTPVSLVGLLLLPLVWWAGTLSRETQRTLAVLAAGSVLFVLAMSIFPKKLNRYIVPIFPMVDVLAAAGLYGAARWLTTRPRLTALPALHTAVRGGLAAVLLVGLVVNVWHWHPYGVVAFNQVLGGAPAGARAFLLGDGEGLGVAAAWLNAQPDSTGYTVASTMIQSLQPFLAPGVQAVSPADTLNEQVGYVLVYLRHTQRGALRAPFNQFYPQQVPVYTVRLHGVAYAWLYETRPPLAQPLAVTLGDTLTLAGYEVQGDAAAPRLLVRWSASAPPPTDYLLFVHVLDRTGQRIAQIDAPPLGNTPTSTMQPGRSYTWAHPLPALPPLAPDQPLWLAMGLYDPATGARLPVSEAPAPPAAAPAATGYDLLVPLTYTSAPAPAPVSAPETAADE